MSDIQLTRLPGYDINGNPRYVCHYLKLLTASEKANPENVQKVFNGMTQGYTIAVNRSHSIGGRKYHNKRYGGGIVFTDYPNEIQRNIKRVVAEAEQAEK